MKLKTLTVGPIVGETTEKTARIWGRGEAQVVDGLPRRCFGAIRSRPYDEEKYSRPIFFKMNPNFDLTGLAILERMESDSYYSYQMGYFYSDVELEDSPTRDIDWSGIEESWFKTSSDNPEAERSIVIGSCRYLLKTFLGDFFDDRGDKTFRSINKLIDSGLVIDQLIMMGDQIYADDLSSFNPDKTVEQFYKRYRAAFSQKHIRKLMSRVSTYMTLDDHEIEDNWPSKASSKDKKTLFPIAVHAYQAYQLSHSPNIPIKAGRLEGTVSAGANPQIIAAELWPRSAPARRADAPPMSPPSSPQWQLSLLLVFRWRVSCLPALA